LVGGPGRRPHAPRPHLRELDEAGKISPLTAIYDSSLLSYAGYQSLPASPAKRRCPKGRRHE